MAQESSEENEYSDYSYLWEDTKKDKKKKKKNKKNTNTTEDTKIETPIINPDTLETVTKPLAPTDSIPLDDTSSYDTKDSIQSEEVTTYQDIDSVQYETYEDIKTETEILNLDSINQVQNLEDSVKKAERLQKRDDRNEKNKDKEPREDFRAGLPSSQSGSSINAGFNYTIIDGKSYAGLTIAPELNLGKVGIGLDVPILYGLDDQKIRTEMFEDGVGFLRLIRYIRVGRQKVDPVYVKVGTLSNTMIGYGGLINNYANSTSYEKRKIGLHYDVNYKGIAGIEGMYSDFDIASLNLLAVRPYVRPLSWTGIPIIRSLEIGGSIIRDNDQTTLFSENELNQTYKFTEEGIGAYGFDMGLTLLKVPFIQIDLFANYSFLDVQTTALNDSIDAINTTVLLDSTSTTVDFKNGNGGSVGFNFRFHFIADLLSTDIRIERLSYSNNYLPQFFDASYEINKDSRILSLANAQKTAGTYGSITGHILQKLTIGGSLLYPDNISETAPAVISLNADVDRLADKFSIHGRYYKGNLDSLEDAFKFDERSLAKVRFVYHINRFIVAGVDYFWAFTPTDDGFTTTQYISPYFGMSIQF